MRVGNSDEGNSDDRENASADSDEGDSDEGASADSDEGDDNSDYESVIFALPVSDHYGVYQLILDTSSHEINLLSSFDSYSEANAYAKQQYCLHTGDPPFIITGMTPGYRSTGSRLPILMPAGIIASTKKANDDSKDYLLIIGPGVEQAHSLNPFAEW